MLTLAMTVLAIVLMLVLFLVPFCPGLSNLFHATPRSS